MQIILAFVLTIYINFALVAIGYVFGCIPKEFMGILDRRLFKIKSRLLPTWTHVLDRVVSVFSDQQIITAIDVQGVAYFKHCTVSVYHFHVVVYLTWILSGTHLVALTVLRS